MRKSIGIISILVTSISISGCATIITGTSQKISVSSDPTGATVQVDGKNSYTAPTKIRLERKRDHVLIFTKDDYQDEKVTITHVLTELICGNVLLGGILGVALDALTGAQFKLVPPKVHVEMKKSTSPAESNH